MGSRSRCTPPRDTSGPCPASRPAILSISSMKTMPAFWARSSASRTTRSMSTSRAASSCVRSSSASFTLSLRLRFFAPPPSIETMGLLPSWLIMSWSPCAMSSMPGAMNGIARRLLGELDLDRLVVERPGAELRARLLAPAGRRAACSASLLPAHARHRAPEPEPEAAAVAERVEHLLLRRLPGALAQLLHLLLLDELHRGLDEVADHRVHVAPDVAHLGELGGLDLHERRAGEPREPARDLGLADAGRADHDDVLGQDLVLQLRRRPSAGASGSGARSRPRASPSPARPRGGPARRRSPSATRSWGFTG